MKMKCSLGLCKAWRKISNVCTHRSSHAASLQWVHVCFIPNVVAASIVLGLLKTTCAWLYTNAARKNAQAGDLCVPERQTKVNAKRLSFSINVTASRITCTMLGCRTSTAWMMVSNPVTLDGLKQFPNCFWSVLSACSGMRDVKGTIRSSWLTSM